MTAEFNVIDERTHVGPGSRIRASWAQISLLLRFADSVSILAAGIGSYFIASSIFGDQFKPQLTLFVGPILIGMFFSCFFFHQFRCYWRSTYLSRHKAVAALTMGWLATWAALVIMAYLVKLSSDYSRAWALIWFCTGLASLTLVRFAAFPFIIRFAKSGAMADRVWLIGHADQLENLNEKLKDESRTHLTTSIRGSTHLPEQVPVDTGDWDQVLDGIDRRIASNEIDTLVVVVGSSSVELMGSLISRFCKTSVEILVICDPLRYPLPIQAKSYRFIGNVPTLKLMEKPISGWSAIAKRLEDIAIAFTCLAFLAPLLAAIGLLVKSTSPGPIFFRQPRFGLDGKLFDVYKFRTMYHDKTDVNADVLATRGDPRVTSIGRILRKTSLDELPQLLNVLTGEMSIVGPRPHAVAAKAGGRLYQEVYDAYMARHRVKPGITGWAQINGWRGETETDEQLVRRVEHDLRYIENWSILFDLYIVFMTPVSMALHRDVY